MVNWKCFLTWKLLKILTKNKTCFVACFILSENWDLVKFLCNICGQYFEVCYILNPIVEVEHENIKNIRKIRY